jgi:uncharacterized protein
MERESFESPRIASILNEHFVAIKVDREQRPDLDQIYMQVVQMLTGSGGWPMSVFLTPQGEPFYGGTYWPPENRWGRPGFDQVLRSVADAWQTKRSAILEQSQEIVSHLQSATQSKLAAEVQPTASNDLSDLFASAEQNLLEIFDAKYGGFGGAPKFPHAMDLKFLMRQAAASMAGDRKFAVTRTLNGMADGGIYDHLGGGFARYSVDEKWLVPHFEKMLYDNALLASAYLDGFRWTGDERYRQVVEETLDYVLREMTDPQGGFYSAEDADSEGEEGKFYVWSQSEIQALLGEKADAFCLVYGVTPGGNFEGHNILNLPKPVASLVDEASLARLKKQLQESGRILLDVRSKRVRPLRDDKVLLSWNALMVIAMAEAGSALNRPDYTQAARACVDFLLQNMRDEQGRLLHVWRDGRAEILGFLDDYSFLLCALVSLWEQTSQPRWLEEAECLAEGIRERFSDPAGGLFFYTAHDAETLITRPKDSQDGSIPSGNSMAAFGLVSLAAWNDRQDYRDLAETMARQTLTWLNRAPMAGPQWLNVLHLLAGDRETWIVLTSQPDEVQQAWRAEMLLKLPLSATLCIIKVDGQGQVPEGLRSKLSQWFEGKSLPAAESAILFICRGQSCLPPILGERDILAASRATRQT